MGLCGRVAPSLQIKNVGFARFAPVRSKLLEGTEDAWDLDGFEELSKEWHIYSL